VEHHGGPSAAWALLKLLPDEKADLVGAAVSAALSDGRSAPRALDDAVRAVAPRLAKG